MKKGEEERQGTSVEVAGGLRDLAVGEAAPGRGELGGRGVRSPGAPEGEEPLEASAPEKRLRHYCIIIYNMQYLYLCMYLVLSRLLGDESENENLAPFPSFPFRNYKWK